ncbi:hypothetical protein FPV67DRAFT_1454674 [Lyophyllum atratum]|nr:hypothetical protein FPV67DRAFT_1454674 [Lyophyllum atratum]
MWICSLAWSRDGKGFGLTGLPEEDFMGKGRRAGCFEKMNGSGGVDECLRVWLEDGAGPFRFLKGGHHLAMTSVADVNNFEPLFSVQCSRWRWMMKEGGRASVLSSRALDVAGSVVAHHSFTDPQVRRTIVVAQLNAGASAVWHQDKSRVRKVTRTSIAPSMNNPLEDVHGWTVTTAVPTQANIFWVSVCQDIRKDIPTQADIKVRGKAKKRGESTFERSGKTRMNLLKSESRPRAVNEKVATSHLSEIRGQTMAVSLVFVAVSLVFVAVSLVSVAVSLVFVAVSLVFVAVFLLVLARTPRRTPNKFISATSPNPSPNSSIQAAASGEAWREQKGFSSAEEKTLYSKNQYQKVKARLDKQRRNADSEGSKTPRPLKTIDWPLYVLPVAAQAETATVPSAVTLSESATSSASSSDSFDKCLADRSSPRPDAATLPVTRAMTSCSFDAVTFSESLELSTQSINEPSKPQNAICTPSAPTMTVLDKEILSIAAGVFLPQSLVLAMTQLQNDIHGWLEVSGLTSRWSGAANSDAEFLDGVDRWVRQKLAAEAESRLIATLVGYWCSNPSPDLTNILKERIEHIPKEWSLENLQWEDLVRLAPATWLNDGLIEHFLSHPPPPSSILCLSPFFYTKFLLYTLTDKTWEKAWKWKNQQIQRSVDSSLRAIMIPVNVEDHWVLLHADLRLRTISVLDSLKSNHNAVGLSKKRLGTLNWRTSTHHKLLEGMRTLISKISAKFQLGLEVEEFQCFPQPPVPFQNNSYDCGVYVIMFARHLQKASFRTGSSPPHTCRRGGWVANTDGKQKISGTRGDARPPTPSTSIPVITRCPSSDSPALHTQASPPLLTQAFPLPNSHASRSSFPADEVGDLATRSHVQPVGLAVGSLYDVAGSVNRLRCAYIIVMCWLLPLDPPFPWHCPWTKAVPPPIHPLYLLLLVPTMLLLNDFPFTLTDLNLPPTLQFAFTQEMLVLLLDVGLLQEVVWLVVRVLQTAVLVVWQALGRVEIVQSLDYRDVGHAIADRTRTAHNVRETWRTTCPCGRTEGISSSEGCWYASSIPSIRVSLKPRLEEGTCIRRCVPGVLGTFHVVIDFVFLGVAATTLAVTIVGMRDFDRMRMGVVEALGMGIRLAFGDCRAGVEGDDQRWGDILLDGERSQGRLGRDLWVKDESAAELLMLRLVFPLELKMLLRSSCVDDAASISVSTSA